MKVVGTRHFEKARFWLWSAVLAVGTLIAPSVEGASNTMSVTITPAAAGRQIVRVSLPFPKDVLRDGYGLVAHDGNHDCPAAVRILTFHPTTGHEPRSARRAMVTFAHDFATRQPTGFVLRAVPPQKDIPSALPVQVQMSSDAVRITYRDGRLLEAKLLAPAMTPPVEPRTETVEANANFLWQRTRLPDTQWPRVIEVRADALGTVVVVAHLQRKLTGDGRAPDFGWEITTRASSGRLQRGNEDVAIGREPVSRPLTDGKPCTFFFGDGAYRIYHPTVPLKRRGRVEVRCDGADALTYRYWRCKADGKVPMQQAAWHRAEFVVAPANQAPLTAALEYPHDVRLDWTIWDALYAMGSPLNLADQPDLSALMRYHHDATVRSMAVGDDWGNVTAYSDDAATGAAFGMNRLNHCPPIFETAFRSGDRRLSEAAVLWCDNFYDQSIWWGPGQTGGTRYNNLIAMGQTPPDNDQSYMWRSNRSVNFCTKGYDSFFLAYEQTGDPRMLEALEAQVRYSAEHVHADRGECRNIGDVREFVRLYEFTGQQRYLDEALRLFRELRTKLSAGDLFSQGGQPIEPNLPFINDDQMGYNHPFAKPYIIGYALAGLPILARYAPDEPKLRDVVRAVADFLADSQDPIGGWRYPDPRSSYLIMSQALEHAWQLAQADGLLGPQEKHLDAIERVLRQRIHGWRKTGKIFAGITGWELATGRCKDAKDLCALYRFPRDRDFTRDYAEGRPDFGSAPPEGLVYFPEVLAFYLRHRPVSRLLAPPKDDDPLGKVLAHITARSE